MKKLLSLILIIAIGICMVSCGGGKSESSAKPKIDAAATFSDVNRGDWFEESVSWGVSEGVISEAKPSLFGVETPMTKAEILMTMWKAAGAPGQVVSAKAVADSDPNSDISKAIEWGLEKGVISIKNEFSSDIASRLEAIDFMWKEAECPTVNGDDNFIDTQGIESVNWAKTNGIALGVGHNLFAPENDCTKAHMVTFLFRAK